MDAFVLKSSDLDFKPVFDAPGKPKRASVGPWSCEVYECTGDMQLQTFRKGAGDNLLNGISMEVGTALEPLHQWLVLSTAYCFQLEWPQKLVVDLDSGEFRRFRRMSRVLRKAIERSI